jgi:hypothetical protein
MEMKNKRKNTRYDCLVPMDGKQGGPFEYTKTVDFSKSGLGFISHRKVPLNKEIAIQLDFSEEGTPALVIGKIRWVDRIKDSENYRVGVSFEDVLKGCKSCLDNYFRSRKETLT